MRFDALLALAYAGAFDEWYDRSAIVRLIYDYYNTKRSTKEKKLIPPITNNFLLYKFYEILGFFEQRLKTLYDGFPVDGRGRPLWFVEADIRGLVEGSPAIVGGILVDVSAFKTRAGDAMGKARLLDLNEEIELTFFPRVWTANRTKIRDGNVVSVTGEKSIYSNKKNLINVTDIEIISALST